MPWAFVIGPMEMLFLGFFVLFPILLAVMIGRFFSRMMKRVVEIDHKIDRLEAMIEEIRRQQ